MGRNQLPIPRAPAGTEQHLVAGKATACPAEPTSGDREREGGTEEERDRKEGEALEGREGRRGKERECEQNPKTKFISYLGFSDGPAYF